MSDRAPALPEGYVLRRGRRGVLVAREELVEGLIELGFGPDGTAPPPSPDLSGRGRLGELQLAGERLVVRRYTHGGLLRWLTGARFADPGRPLHELELAERLLRAGIPTLRVVATRTQRAPGFGFHLELVTRRLEGVHDLAEWLESLRAGEVGVAERRRVFEACGELVGRLHAQGFLHADLHPRNVLMDAQGELLVIDLDRSRFTERLDDGERRDNLRRLLRAVLRREERGRRFLSRADLRRFLRGYARGLGQAASDWRTDWRAIERDRRRNALWHRLGWWAEGSLAGGPGRRDGRASVRS